MLVCLVADTVSKYETFPDDDDDEEGSELEGNERSEFREHGGLSGAGAAGGMDNDYLFLHLDEPRQGRPCRSFRYLAPRTVPSFPSASSSRLFPSPHPLLFFPTVVIHDP